MREVATAPFQEFLAPLPGRLRLPSAPATTRVTSVCILQILVERGYFISAEGGIGCRND